MIISVNNFERTVTVTVVMPIRAVEETRKFPQENMIRKELNEAIVHHETRITVSLLFFAAGAAPGLKADLDDGGGTSDSRLSEQEEEAIAMSMVPAGS